MDLAYANGAFIPGADSFAPRWAGRAAVFRGLLGYRAQVGMSYGPGDRHKFDLFLPEGDAKGVVIFVHGGYWMAFGRETWSHLAEGVLARGWAMAIPSYTLAPTARISSMTKEIALAISVIARQVDGPVVITGHSAGGHLSARMACEGVLKPEVASRVTRAVPISPLAELAPLMQTKMNEKLRLTTAECATESPARLTRRADCDVTVWVGGQERPAFLWQARLLSEAWDCRWHVAPSRHHFDVIDDLTNPRSLLVGELVTP
ncbi:MAG: alpha/beta hydrolase [Cereibacter sphaeroides]|uniref:Alpha/beta hydrolase n=1 Tax=Cereibacter sphaeroides TaxID=1063 RepID=A0A2W5S4M5_CERSP|nr:MAG: alpha/beta hydrolase [Cereibacter sphaeroides]